MLAQKKNEKHEAEFPQKCRVFISKDRESTARRIDCRPAPRHFRWVERFSNPPEPKVAC